MKDVFWELYIIFTALWLAVRLGERDERSKIATDQRKPE
jgi:hypothetical protein